MEDILCILSTSPEIMVGSKKGKKKGKKEKSYTAWSLLSIITVLILLHSFLHNDREEALFTRETIPCVDVEERLSPCKLYHTLITEPVISMQICDSHSKAWMFHTLCATEPGWWNGNSSLSKHEWTEIKEKYLLFMESQNWQGWKRSLEISHQTLAPKQDELQQVA